VRQATARLLAHSVRLDGYLRFVPKHVTVPVLLLLAGRDRIIDNDRIRELLRLTNLDTLWAIYDTRQQALDALGGSD